MVSAYITELDAVNQMLLSIGEQKVNSLDSTGIMEVDTAKTTLDEVSRTVQEEDWHFNVEHNVRLLPDENGVIFLPKNCTNIWLPQHSGMAVVQRGVRLYNLVDHSYQFDTALTVSMRLFLKFDELIPAAAHYISMRASRWFQERVTGSQVTEEFLLREEAAARIRLVADDSTIGKYNIVMDNEPTRQSFFRDWY